MKVGLGKVDLVKADDGLQKRLKRPNAAKRWLVEVGSNIFAI